MHVSVLSATFAKVLRPAQLCKNDCRSYKLQPPDSAVYALQPVEKVFGLREALCKNI